MAPRDWRWIVGGAGKALIALGLLMFGFVGYQLWGTGIETELAQQRLEDDFDELLAAVDADEFTSVAAARSIDPTTGATSTPERPDPAAQSNEADEAVDIADPDNPELATVAIDATAPAIAAAVPVTEQRFPALTNGSALAKLEIPAIGVDDIVVAGIDVSDLKKGPGHFPDTPLPGQLGNVAIAGHRTTYGAPFFDVDQLVPGDEMIVTTLDGRYVYEVTGTQIVSPSDYEVISTSDPTRAQLTLVSCDPKFTALNRIIVQATLDVERSGAVGAPLLNYGRETPTSPTVAQSERTAVESPAEVVDDDDSAAGPADADPLDEAVSDRPQSGAVDGGDSTGSLLDRSTSATPEPTADTADGLAEAFGQGWFSDPSANAHVGAWGLLLSIVSLAAWWLSRRFGRNLVGAAAGIGPFILVLYFFYQNVNRLLPPGL